MEETWECIVVGAGAAGLSAGLVLGRARRRTLIIGAEEQSNRVADGIGGLLGNDTRAPAEFYAAVRAELAAYPAVQLRHGEVVAGETNGLAFELQLHDGSRETTRRVLLATGMSYRYPSLTGAEQRWGRSVFHCPFCHGWEHRDRPLGVLGRGATGAQRAMLMRAWSDDVTLLSDGPAELDADTVARLRAAGVNTEQRPLATLDGPAENLRAVVFADGSERELAGLLVAVTLHQRSGLATQLGAAVAEAGPLSSETVKVNAQFSTTVPGLYAAGDLAAQMPSVANAVAAGANAAAMIVHDLLSLLPAPTPLLVRQP